MEVLCVWEVRQERQDQADCQPETDVFAHSERTFTPTRPKLAERRTEGLPRVAAFERQLEAVANPAEPDMKQDKEGYDQRVAANATLLDAFDQLHVVAVAQRLVIENEAAEDEVDHAN